MPRSRFVTCHLPQGAGELCLDLMAPGQACTPSPCEWGEMCESGSCLQAEDGENRCVESCASNNEGLLLQVVFAFGLVLSVKRIRRPRAPRRRGA